MAQVRKGSAAESGAIRISEEGGVRLLHIGGPAVQSAMRLEAPGALELDYTRAMMAFLLFAPAPREVLMVGLGGGSIARFIHDRLPETRVSVVEVSPGVIAAARRYFALPEDDARLRVIVGDGAEYVPRHPGSAEVLLLDGFEDGAHAAALCTQSFYDCAHAALRDGGILAANFIADDRKLELSCQRIERSFGGRVLRLAAEDKVNLIVLAFRGGPARIGWDELKARARALQRDLDLPFDHFVKSLKTLNAHGARHLRIARG